VSTLVIGGTAGLGLEFAKFRVSQGEDVILTGRDLGRAEQVASSIGARGLAVDLSQPHGIAAALADVETVGDLVIAGIERDANTVADYNMERATRLATIKLIGYTEVIHTLLGRMHDDSAVVLFGGRAKDRPYPGSTTVSTVNGAVVGMVNALALEIAPIRVNAIHPGIVGDSPFWADKPEAVLEGYRTRTPTGRLATMDDITGAVDFLLRNRGVNAVNLYVDGGWLIT
jgi:NAD(P)-dependent dehydrogenase (short-subunit alcohol dehydrogenase family)